MWSTSAILICLLVTFILSRGTKTFDRFELVAVAIKIVLILFIIGLGIFYIPFGHLLRGRDRAMWPGKTTRASPAEDVPLPTEAAPVGDCPRAGAHVSLGYHG